MRDYNGNGEIDKEDCILLDEMINEQEQTAKDAKHHSFFEYIGAFIILFFILKVLHLI
ncbi:MAG: hypothetical protein MR663_13395 [Lachnospiraceae bacterium]|nr:hypothetical protein [Lachnospiraceae bacterium]